MADGSRSPEICMKPKMRSRSILIGDLLRCRGGLSSGAKCGMRQLDMPVKLIGVNHRNVAIKTHRRNHRQALPFCRRWNATVNAVSRQADSGCW